MTDSRDHRQAWNERYAAEEALWGSDPNQFVVRYAGSLPPGKALDLGCGQGRNAVWLAQRRHEVTAIDFSDVAIAQAREHAKAAGVAIEFVAADLVEFEPEPAGYDVVLLSYLQLPDAERRLVHRKAIAALAPGGTLIVVAHHLDNLFHGVAGPPTLDVLFTEEQLEEDFGTLHIDVNDRVLRHVERGGMSGDAIDVVLVARKIAAP